MELVQNWDDNKKKGLQVFLNLDSKLYFLGFTLQKGQFYFFYRN